MTLIPDLPAPGDKQHHQLTGLSFDVAGTITPLIDLWLEDGRLPDYMRASPKLGR